jgi:UDP-N-acetylglucosamine--N-acetylmuramyl-(pentapeptide) pyrophosphoryl-undecaprenol N-acetylglucosamine transferase
LGKKIFIAAGGTGGHVFPGLAIADELKLRSPVSEVVFVGTDMGMEKDIIPARGFRLIKLKANRIKGKNKIRKAISMISLPVSIARALAVVVKEKPDLVVSVGGYAAGPISLAGWMCRVPVATLEPNAIPGFANRMISKFASKIFVAFDSAKKFFGDDKVIKTGVPVRKEILSAAKPESESMEKFTVLVVGGSLGSRKLNDEVSKSAFLLSDFKDRLRFIHQTGKDASAAGVADAYLKSGIEAEVFEFKSDIWNSYAKANLAISRSGASAVTELSALNVPTIFVPYPFAADDHQRANAAEFSEKGCAMTISDEAFTAEKAAAIIREMINSPEKLSVMKKKLSALGLCDAAKKIADECMGMIG